MKFLLSLLVVLATSDAFFLRNPFGSYDDDVTSSRSISHYDNKELARRLGDILARALRNNQDISHYSEPDKTDNPETVQTYSTEPVQSYDADPIQTYDAEPVLTYNDEPVETYTAEPVETYIAEPVNLFASQYIAEPVNSADEPVQHFFNIMFS